jgi:WD40 repeat protein/DNA-binding SARP family transcriptional activator
MKSVFQLRFLGPVQIERDGEPVRGFESRKALALLAYLAVERQPVPRERLVDLFWEDKTEAQGRNNLNWVLNRLSTFLPGCLQADRHTVQFLGEAEENSYWLDMDGFEELRASGDPVSLAAAVELYRGEFLEGLVLRGCPEFELWQVREQERWRRRVSGALNQLVAHHSRQAGVDQGLRFARRLLELEPWREEAHRGVMRLLALDGQRGAALAQYETCRRLLAEELGVEPSEATELLYTQIQAGELEPPALVPKPELPPQPPAPGEPPFKGLEFFDVADADLFFGREALTARLVQHLHSSPGSESGERFLAVVGTSGSGKSSLVRAGLVAALQRDAPLIDGSSPPEGSHLWPMVIITPTASPLESLAAGLTRDVESVTATATLMDDLARDTRSLHLYIHRKLSPNRSGRRLFLVVDQFEELFTQCRDPAQRKAFIDNLLTAAGVASPGEKEGTDDGPTVMVITLRADFYHHCAQFENLRMALENHQVYIGPMTPEELRRTIEEPARAGGWELEPGLVDLLLRDVGEEPGALPLLSHALLETWKRRQGHTLTLDGYTEAGGVHGAIARTAEAVYQQLDEHQQAIARNIFLRLTELGEGTGDVGTSLYTRRRATLDELFPHPEDASAVETVLHTLADARLITTERETVQVAHEALIREWPTLREWLEEDREGLRVHRHLTEAAQEWERLDRDPGELYRGTRLDQASAWAKAQPEALNPLEREFLAASEKQVRQEQAVRERRRRRLTWATVGAALIFLVLAIASGTGWWQAEQRRQAALARLSRQLAAQSALQLTANKVDMAMLLAIEAARTADTVEAVSALHRVSTRLGHTLVTLSGHMGWVNWAVWNSDESRILTAGQDGTARVWDAETGAELLTLSGHTDGVWWGIWNSDDSRILTASDDGTARVWDVSTLRQAQGNAGLNTGAETGTELLTLSGHPGWVSWAVWNRDESRILTAGCDTAGADRNENNMTECREGTARVWDAETGVELLALSGHTDGLRQAIWNRDESCILTASHDGTARVWDAETGLELVILSGHTDWIFQAMWNRDESRILTASEDGTARVWDAETGAELLTLSAHAEWVFQAVWSSDGSRVLTAGCDYGMSSYCLEGTARVWDAETGAELLTLPCRAGAFQAMWNADESLILTAGCDRDSGYRCLEGAARVWDVSAALNTGAETGAELFTLLGHTDGVWGVMWNADESRILTASDDGTARVWDVERGGKAQSVTLSGHTDDIRQAIWNRDGSRILTASHDGAARVWDAETGAELVTLSGHAAEIRQAVWNSDKSRILTASFDGTARVWDAETGDELLVLSGHMDYVDQAVWNSDESRILTASFDGTARVWDARTAAELLNLSGHTGVVHQAVWNSDESRILTASFDGTAQVWDAATGAVLLTLSGHTGAVWQAVWSSDERRILTASNDGTARVWDAKTGTELLTLSRNTRAVRQAAWSSDERRILTASADGTARMWDAATGAILVTLSGHTRTIRQAGWSPDEKRVLTASNDGTARVWDAETGAELFTLSSHGAEVLHAVWKPDGSRILTVSTDGIVRQWYIQTEDLLEDACQRAPRNMTWEEWQQFMGEEEYHPTCPELPVPGE